MIEEAEGYQVLTEKFQLTQEQIAQRVGRARASVTNTMRLLGLPDAVKRLVAGGQLSPGHAKVLLGVEIEEERTILAQRVIKEALSVRNLERIIERFKRGGRRRSRAAQEDMPATHVAYLSDILHRHFGTSVRILPCRTLANGKKAKGSIEVDFFSSEDLNRLLHVMGLEDVP